MVNYYDGDDDAWDDGWDDDGFEDYVVTTVDPGPAAFIVTVFFSVVMILLIPFCLALREKFRKSYRRRRNRYGPMGADGIMKGDGDGVFLTSSSTQLPPPVDPKANRTEVEVSRGGEIDISSRIPTPQHKPNVAPAASEETPLAPVLPPPVEGNLQSIEPPIPLKREPTAPKEEVETVIDVSVLKYNYSDKKDSTSTRKTKKENKEAIKAPDLLSADLLGSHAPEEAPQDSQQTSQEIEVTKQGAVKLRDVIPPEEPSRDSAARVIKEGPIDLDTNNTFEEEEDDAESDSDDEDAPAYGLPEYEDEYDIDSQSVEVEYRPPTFYEGLFKFIKSRKDRRLQSAAKVVRAIPITNAHVHDPPETPAAAPLGTGYEETTPEAASTGYQQYNDDIDNEEDVFLNNKLDQDDVFDWNEEMDGSSDLLTGVELTGRVREEVVAEEGGVTSGRDSPTKKKLIIEGSPVKERKAVDPSGATPMFPTPQIPATPSTPLEPRAEPKGNKAEPVGPAPTPAGRAAAYQPPAPIIPATPDQPAIPEEAETFATPEQEMTELETAKMPPQQPSTPAASNPQEYIPSSPKDDYFESLEKKVDVNLCCGRRPWYRFLCSKRFRNKVRKCASFDKEMKGLMKLAIPFTIQAIVGHFFDLFELAIVGRLLGTNELSAYYVVDFVMSLSTMALEGFGASLFTLCSHAVGAQMYKLAGQYVQMATITYQVLLVPATIFWWFYIEDIVLWLGFGQEVTEIAYDYYKIVFISYLLSPYDEAMHYLMETGGHEIDAAIIALTHSVLSFLLTLLYSIYGNPSLRDLEIVHLGLDMFFTFVSIGVGLYFGWLQPYLKGLIGSNAFGNKKAVKLFFKQAIPLSFGYIMAYGEWEILFIFAGLMGPAEVAVWGLLGSLWEAIEDIGLSTADAAEVRVALLLGADQPKRARYCAHKALFVGCSMAIFATIPFWFLRNQIPAFFTKDETLQKMFTDLVPYICVGNVTMMFGSMAWTLLGAQGRFGLATVMGFIGSWGLTLPLSAVATLVFNFDLQAMTGAIVVGYACSGALNSYFLLRSNWAKIARKIQRKNRLEADKATGKAKEVGSFDRMLWKEMPYEAQKAGMLLGFDERKWNKDKEPYTFTYTWYELQPNQQEAALFLGYKPETWGPGADEDYDEYEWDQLPEHIREAYEVLGYDEKMWTKDKEPYTFAYTWQELQPNQQEAATSLGYTAETWGPNAKEDYDEYEWDELPGHIREAYEVLGYTKELWNAEDGEEPESCDKYWRELTPEEQAAAKQVGYSEQKWDGGDESDDS